MNDTLSPQEALDILTKNLEEMKNSDPAAYAAFLRKISDATKELQDAIKQ